MLAGSAWMWSELPEDATVPIHWSFGGQPDLLSNRLLGLLLMPLVVIGNTTLFYFLPRMEPRRQHFFQSLQTFKIIWIGVTLLLAAVHLIILLAASGRHLNITQYIPLAVGILFLVMRNYQGKIRSNYILGIKTPWTLSSELSWNKTHRLAGKLFMLLGGLLILSVIIDSSLFLRLVIGIGVPGTVITEFVYSYLVWRSDPKAGKKNQITDNHSKTTMV